MSCKLCDFVKENPFKICPKEAFKRAYDNIRSIEESMYQEEIENEEIGYFIPDPTDVYMNHIIHMFLKIKHRVMQRKLHRDYSSKIGTNPSQEAKWKTKLLNQSHRLEYLASCIQSYFGFKGKLYPGDRDPFLVGGIPLSEETRKRFRGMLRPRFYNYPAVLVPIFGEEGEEIHPKKRRKVVERPVKKDFYLCRTSGNCDECGSAKTNMANAYYRKGCSTETNMGKLIYLRRRQLNEEDSSEESV